CTSYQWKESDKNISFHRIPSDPKAYRAWSVKIRRDIGPHFQVSEGRAAECNTEENENLRSQQFCLQRFQCEPKMIMFYTGFKDYETLKALYQSLQPTAQSLFFLFLGRIRQGLLSADLAVRFNLSKATVSRICITWANYLYFMLGTLPVWPSREAVDELMPPCFKQTFPKTHVVLDCTEIHIQTASSKVLNTVTYSHYKGTTTLKSLIGITQAPSLTRKSPKSQAF
ncbi:hypothetical protein PO909_020313, partial [Leuciscus waleckii]